MKIESSRQVRTGRTHKKLWLLELLTEPKISLSISLLPMIKGRSVAHISTGWPVTVNCRPCLIFLTSDWSMLVTWSEYWPLIGLDILICWMLLFLLFDVVIWTLDPLYAHGLLKRNLKCPLLRNISFYNQQAFESSQELLKQSIWKLINVLGTPVQ